MVKIRWKSPGYTTTFAQFEAQVAVGNIDKSNLKSNIPKARANILDSVQGNVVVGSVGGIQDLIYKTDKDALPLTVNHRGSKGLLDAPDLIVEVTLDGSTVQKRLSKGQWKTVQKDELRSGNDDDGGDGGSGLPCPGFVPGCGSDEEESKGPIDRLVTMIWALIALGMLAALARIAGFIYGE